MSVRIVVDSTADMPSEIRDRLTVVPLSVMFGEDTYIDGITINHHEFYEKLVSSDVFPTTSQPSPDAFASVYEEAKKSGDTLVVLTLSSLLSGTCQSAMIAAQDYPDMVHVVDTTHVANGFGILAEYALELVDRGMSAEEIVAEIENVRGDIEFYALLDTLEYLQKGGRISKTAAIAGGLLSLKPILTMKDGKLESKGKARGVKQGDSMMVKEILAAGGVDFDKPYLLAYTGLTDANAVRFAQNSAQIWSASDKPVRIVPLCPVVGTHAGPGAVVVAFFKKKN